MSDQQDLAARFQRQNPGLVDQPIRGDWIRFGQHKDETVWDEHEHEVTRDFANDTWVLTLIPEEGLWGQYYGQGDLQWAWVRLAVWRRWARPEIVAAYDKSLSRQPATGTMIVQKEIDMKRNTNLLLTYLGAFGLGGVLGSLLVILTISKHLSILGVVWFVLSFVLFDIAVVWRLIRLLKTLRHPRP